MRKSEADESVPDSRRVGPAVRQVRATALLAALLATVALLPGLLRGPLRHWDEAWYAQTAREMRAAGDWLTVRWNGAPWFHKPPLYFWMTLAAYEAAGESAVTARVPAYLSGVALVALIAGTATAWGGPPLGWFAALALLAIPDWLTYASRGQLDSTLLLLLSLHYLLFLRGLDHSRAHLAAGLCLGLALLTKGGAALLGPWVQGAYLLLARDSRPLRQPLWWAGWLLAVLVAAPWHLQQTITHGQEFWQVYGPHNFSQFFQQIYPDIDDAHPPATFYVRFLLKRQQPAGWCILATLLVGAVVCLRRFRHVQADEPGPASESPAERARLLLLWAWPASVLVGLSLSRAKWDWYLLPMYPGVALLAAELLRRTRPALVLPVLLLPALLAATNVYRAATEPTTKEYEDRIAAFAPAVQEYVPPNHPLHVLQMDRRSTSIYPIAVVYYCDRQTHVLRGHEHLRQVIAAATAPMYLLAHESQLPALEAAALRLARLADHDAIHLLRIEPGENSDRAVPAPLE